jgi:serine/threonine protein kinase
MDGVSGATGGNFSCGYEIVHNTRGTAFLKALDYTAAFKLPDPPSALNSLTAAFLFERNVLGRCVARNMDRVVRSIGEGRVKVDDSPLGTVDYLIFEAAAGDLRTQMSAMKKVETAWKLRALHHMATGVNQLHAAQIAHQDLKPSNVLIFETQEAKVADLGCASLRGTLSPRDDRPFAGDPAYAPPELHYGYTDPEWTNRRLGCDAYLMGSMIVFMFTGSSLTALLSTELAPAHRWGAWKGTYADVLPYVRDAFDRAIEVFGRHIEGDELRKELQTMLRHLCEPDVSLRGHPLNRRGFAAKFSLERFVSKLDLLARRSEFTLR